MNPTTKLGLVVVGFHSDDVWDVFFDGIRESTLKPLSIVVVENGLSVSHRVRELAELPIRILHRPNNPGYGTAANIGVQELPASCEWVVIANPDVRLECDTLEKLFDARDTFPQTGILGPQIKTPSGATYPSARAIPGIRIGVGHALLGRLWPKNPWTSRYLGVYGDAEARTTGWLSGAFLLVKREIFELAGGFDEGYFMFFEDVDLCFRLRMLGFRNVYVPSSVITHSGAHATKSSRREMIHAHHKSAERFLSKLYPRRSQAALRVLIRIGLRLRSAIESSLSHQ